MKRLLMAAGALLLFACGSPSPAPTPNPTLTLPPSPTTQSCVNVPPVYHPYRFVRPDGKQGPPDCATVTGVVLANLREGDGDRHLWIAPDVAYEHLLNAANVYNGHRALVAEIVPACTTAPANSTAASQCSRSKILSPAVGAHVRLTGLYVTDTVHGWNELHPVASLVVLSALEVNVPDE